MCTAISQRGSRHLFGRTLDFSHSFEERVVITPREYPLRFLRGNAISSPLSIIGMARVEAKTPLYFDAMNEAGLAMAGLHFPLSAVYHPAVEGKENVPSYELVGWVLRRYRTLTQALEGLRHVNVTAESVSPSLPATPLHWMLSDKSGSAVIESVGTGLAIYENPYSVLTNEPPFPYHTARLADYAQLSALPPQNRLSPSLPLTPVSGGTGAMGLPGDYSSPSRFVRAFFAKEQASPAGDAGEEVIRFFHVMQTVSVPLGCVQTEEGGAVRTVYTSCADTEELVYYFTTYGSGRLRAVPLTPYSKGSSLVEVAVSHAPDIAFLPNPEERI